MNNPYLAHFGAQIATARFGAIRPGIAGIVVELDRWLTFVKEGGRGGGRGPGVRQDLMTEDNEHNSFSHFPTTDDPSYDIGPEALTIPQARAVRNLFAEAARVATIIEDYNTDQNKVASFKAGPGAGPTTRLKTSFTVPGFDEEVFPCGYYVGLDYEAVIPRYRSSRYQQRFLVVLLALLSDAVEAKHRVIFSDAPVAPATPIYVKFMEYGHHLTKASYPLNPLDLDPGLTVKNRDMRAVLAGLYSQPLRPRTGQEDNHDESGEAVGSLYRALISFVTQRIYPWLNCKMPIKLSYKPRSGYPWVLNQHYFSGDDRASLTIIQHVPEDRRGENCDDISDLPIPVVEVNRLPTTEQRAALASPLPGAGVRHINWRNTMCRPFGAIATPSTDEVVYAPHRTKRCTPHRPRRGRARGGKDCSTGGGNTH